MERTARPPTVDDLKLLIKALNDEGVEYLLVGAYALFALGYQRATTDIDLLVPQSAEAGARVKRALLTLPEQAARDRDRMDRFALERAIAEQAREK